MPASAESGLLLQGSFHRSMLNNWSAEENFEGENLFQVPEAAYCLPVVPEADGIGETTVFADGSFVRNWNPRIA